MPIDEIDPSKVQWDEAPQIDPSQVQWDQTDQPKDTLGGQVAAGLRGVRQALPFGQDIGAAAHALQRGQSFSEAKQREIAEDEARKAQYPGTYLAGEVVGSVAPFVAGPVAGLEAATERYLAPKVGETAAQIGSGALLGASTGVAQGLGQGVTAEERLKAAGEQGLMGGVAGGVLSPIAGKIGQAAKGFLPNASETEQAIRQAREIGVDLPSYTLGEGDTGKMLASGLSSVPFGSGPISQATKTALEQTGEAASKVFQETGAATPAMAGTLAETNIQNWIKGSSAAQLDAAFKDMSDVVPPSSDTVLGNLRGKVDSILAARKGARLPSEESRATDIVKDALADPTPMTFENARRLRTEIGNRLSNIYRLPGSVDTGELKTLYGALTKDLEDAARKTGGEEGVSAFRRANRMTDVIRGQQSRLAKIIGVKEGTYSPEQILGNIEKLARTGNKGDVNRLMLARKAVNPNDWQTISSGIIGKLGRDNEGNFSPNLFMTGYNKMAPNARDVLFGTSGTPVRKSLDAIEQVSYRLRDAMKFANTSKTSHAIHAMEFLTGMLYNPIATIGAAAASNGVARILATPKTAQYAAGLAKAIENASKTASEASPISRNAAVIAAYNAYANAVRDTVGGKERPERAKGGRIGKPDYPAKRLTLAAKRAHREIADESRPLMDMPDEHIAEALHRAKS